MIIISTESIHAVPLFDPITHLVYSTSKSDVKHVFIGGKQCVKDGKIISFNIEDILNEVRNLREPILKSLI